MLRLARTPRRVAAAAVLAIAAGCSSDATSPQQQFAGTYTLRTVGGQGLPVVVDQSSGTTTAIAADVYTFSSDGTFTEQLVLTFTQGTSSTSQTQSYNGTWTISGSTVTVNDATENQTFTATFSGSNTLTYNEPSIGVFVYQK